MVKKHLHLSARFESETYGQWFGLLAKLANCSLITAVIWSGVIAQSSRVQAAMSPLMNWNGLWGLLGHHFWDRKK